MSNEKLREALIDAYTAGATATHDWWAAGNVEREADFTEAAHDYARQALASIPVNKDEASRRLSADERDVLHCALDASVERRTPDRPVTGDGVEDVVERVAITDQDREAAQPFDRYLRGANSLGNLRYAFAKHRHAALSAAKPVPREDKDTA